MAESQKNESIDLSFESKELGLQINNLMSHCYRVDENNVNQTYLLVGAQDMIPNYQIKVKTSWSLKQA